LWTPVRDNAVWQAMKLPHVVEVEASGTFRSDCGGSWDEVGMLRQGIHYYHDGVISSRIREFHNEVHTHGVPSELWDWKWFKVFYWGPAYCFGSEALITCGCV